MNFRFSFEELSLLSQDGFNLRLEANGDCDVEYDEQGNYWLDAIRLEGTRWNAAKFAYARKSFEIFGEWERETIKAAILQKYRQDIQDRIRDELNERGISIPDPNREHLELSAS